MNILAVNMNFVSVLGVHKILLLCVVTGQRGFLAYTKTFLTPSRHLLCALKAIE